MRRLVLIAFAAALALPAAACATDDAPGASTDDGSAIAVLPGKADDYLSPTSLEYAMWGLGEVVLDETWADKTDEEKEAHVKDMLGYRFKAYSHFINAYITDKSSHDSNGDYGGFAGLVRSTSLEWVYDPMDDAKMNWAFIWEFEVGGPSDLMERLPIQINGDGDEYFLVTMPVLTESQLKYGSFPKAFDPAVYEGETEEFEVMVDPKEASPDGWPEYGQLFADDVIDIAIVVGGDYNDKRYDLLAAEEIFDWLKANYDTSLTAYTDLALDSPPFTGAIDVAGREVKIAISMVYPDIVEDADLDQVRTWVADAYESADIVIYDGHAGQDPDYSGVVYHYNPRHAISATALGELNLPEKYQIFVFNGCKTYSAYPEAVMKNETKTTANLDIVSTVNFSWLSQQTFTTSGLLRELLATKAGTHDAHTWREVLTRINVAANHNVYYGVHGIEDNPHLNPYADTSTLCATCSSNADCPGAGNLCVALEGGKVCAAECTANDGCPSGYVCGDIAVGGQITGHQCLPQGYACTP